MMFCGITDILHWIVYFIWQFFGLSLAFAGLFLDFSINISIENFSKFIDGVQSIKTAWTVIRDALTITFIFTLLYAGIQMILGLGTNKNILRGVIIAGLLINFSFFFTSIIIDVSNVLTVEIYKSVEKFGNNNASFTTGPAALSGVSAALMQGLKPIGTAGVPAGTEGLTLQLAGSQAIIRLIMGSIFLLISTFVLLAIALILILRVLILIVLLITSPISVMGGLFPQLSGFSKKWWGELISQAIQAPILMLSLFVTIIVINHPSFQSTLNTLIPTIDDTTSPGVAIVLVMFGGSIQNVFTFLIAIGLLITGMIVAKSAGGEAGGKATAFASGLAGKLAFGGTAALGAHTMGRLGGRLAESNFANRLKGDDRIGRQLLGSALVNIGSKAGKASFDVRGALPGQIGAGKAAPGFIEREKNLKKEREDAAKQIKTNADEAAKEHAKREELAKRNRFNNIDAEIGSHEAAVLAAKIKQGQSAAGPDKEAADREVHAALAKLDAARKFKATGAPTTEEEARQNLAGVASTTAPQDIGAVNAVINSDDIKSITDPAERQTKILSRLDDKQRKYFEALQELIAIEKQKELYEKDFKAQFAAANAASKSSSIQEVSDKMRRELAQGKKDKAWEALKKAMKDEGVAVDEKGVEKPTTDEKPKGTEGDAPASE